MLRCSPAGLLDVVDRHVLEEAGHRVEAKAAVGVDVREPNAPSPGERPPVRRYRYCGIEHAGEPTPAVRCG